MVGCSDLQSGTAASAGQQRARQAGYGEAKQREARILLHITGH